LRRDHVEKFAARRHAAFVEFEQQSSPDTQPFVDLKATVEIGVVDNPLPAHGGARLFEIDAHHDQQIGATTILGLLSLPACSFAAHDDIG
jgi:hypothetical protein